MPLKQHDRQYDLVVFGATGYTGALTAEHIAASLPSNLKWAVAGRSEAKLQTIVEECRKLNPDRIQPEIEICNLEEQDLQALAKKTFILLTTVGPYTQYGELAFKACAENGTHYADVTGEAPWVRRMIEKYEKTAKASGAMLFPQLGIESAPPDLIVWALAKEIRETLSSKTGAVKVSIHKLNSAPSGGTLASFLGLFDTFTLKELQQTFTPYSMSPVPNTNNVPTGETLANKLFGVRHVPELGLVSTSLAGTTDAAIVERSWGLYSSLPSRQEEFYGPNFTFKELFKVRNWLHGVALHLGLSIGSLVVASPLRHLIRPFVYKPGQGPDKETSKKDEIELRGTAVPDEAADKLAFARATFHGSMYYLTGVMLGQAALTMLEVDVDLPGGVYTASSLGQEFIDRLDGAGFRLETKVIER